MIVLMECFSRSGGTLLNKILGSLPNVVILSEVNPLGGGWGKARENSHTTPKDQALNWYGITLKSEDYAGSILELHNICKDKTIVVRDWPYVNFVPCKENQHNPPNRLLAYEQLKEHTDVKVFALVRDFVDIWISHGKPPVKQYFANYERYIKELKRHKIRLFKYEDLCRNPSETIKDICSYTGLTFSEDYKNYFLFDNANGDTQNINPSRGARLKKITVLKRPSI